MILLVLVMTLREAYYLAMETSWILILTLVTKAKTVLANKLSHKAAMTLSVARYSHTPRYTRHAVTKTELGSAEHDDDSLCNFSSTC